MRLYVDYMSQPSRACVVFSRTNSLPVDIAQVLIHKGETRSLAFLAKSPLGKVPLLEDEGAGLVLPESGAILTYLAEKYADRVPDHWLPRSPAPRAIVDASMHWYHGNIRAGCAKYLFNKVIAARLGKPCNEEVAQDGLATLHLSLELLGGYWLAGGRRAYMGRDEAEGGAAGPGLGDLLCCSELEQLVMLRREAHGMDMETILQPYPLVRAWMARVAAACQPHYDDAHRLLRRAASTPAKAVNSKL